MLQSYNILAYNKRNLNKEQRANNKEQRQAAVILKSEK